MDPHEEGLEAILCLSLFGEDLPAPGMGPEKTGPDKSGLLLEVIPEVTPNLLD